MNKPNSLVGRIEAWCPRLREDTVFLSPQFSFSTGGKMIFFILLASYASRAIRNGVPQMSDAIFSDISDLIVKARYIGGTFTEAAAGILALSLAAYYLATHEVNWKHRLLFNLVLTTLVAHEAIILVTDLLIFPYSFFMELPLPNQLNFLLMVFGEALSLAVISYAFNRSRKGQQITTSTFFALLAAYFGFSLVSSSLTTLYINPLMFGNSSQLLTRLVSFIMINVAYLLALIISIRAFTKLRSAGVYEFKLSPSYKAAFLIYGVSHVFILVSYFVISPTYLAILGAVGLPAILDMILSYVQYLSLAAVAFTSLRISVVEDGKHKVTRT